MSTLKLIVYGQVNRNTVFSFSYPGRLDARNPLSMGDWVRSVFDPQEVKYLNAPELFVTWRSQHGYYYGLIVPALDNPIGGKQMLVLHTGVQRIADSTALVTALRNLVRLVIKANVQNATLLEAQLSTLEALLVPEDEAEPVQTRYQKSYYMFNGEAEIADNLSKIGSKEYGESKRIYVLPAMVRAYIPNDYHCLSANVATASAQPSRPASVRPTPTPSSAASRPAQPRQQQAPNRAYGSYGNRNSSDEYFKQERSSAGLKIAGGIAAFIVAVCGLYFGFGAILGDNDSVSQSVTPPDTVQTTEQVQDIEAPTEPTNEIANDTKPAAKQTTGTINVASATEESSHHHHHHSHRGEVDEYPATDPRPISDAERASRLAASPRMEKPATAKSEPTAKPKTEATKKPKAEATPKPKAEPAADGRKRAEE